MDEKIINTSMTIILHAGDARNYNTKALRAISKFDFKEAKEQYSLAKEKIVLAHKEQTQEIQGETRGEESEYSVLFAHAQDTLMTVYSELNVCKELIMIFESYSNRLEEIEEKLKNLTTKENN